MRKITQRIATAFHSHNRLSISNTMTDGESVWLHGNKIIKRENNEIYFSLAGWNTLTTRERINGIVGNKVIYRIKGEAFINNEWGDVCIGSKDWVPLASCNSIENNYPIKQFKYIPNKRNYLCVCSEEIIDIRTPIK